MDPKTRESSTQTLRPTQFVNCLLTKCQLRSIRRQTSGTGASQGTRSTGNRLVSIIHLKPEFELEDWCLMSCTGNRFECELRLPWKNLQKGFTAVNQHTTPPPIKKHPHLPSTPPLDSLQMCLRLRCLIQFPLQLRFYSTCIKNGNR